MKPLFFYFFITIFALSLLVACKSPLRGAAQAQGVQTSTYIAEVWSGNLLNEGEPAGTLSLTYEALDTGELYGYLIGYGSSCALSANYYHAEPALKGTMLVTDYVSEAELSINFEDALNSKVSGSLEFLQGSCVGVTHDFELSPAPKSVMLDSELRALLFQHDAFPLTKPETNAAQVELGKFLFHDKILSGNQDVSCSSCHSLQKATGDALSLAVGTGAQINKGKRVLGEDRSFIARHSPDLFNRAFSETLLWDGGVSGNAEQGFQAELELPDGLEHVLAVQTMLAVLNREEMRGAPQDETRLATLDDDVPELIWSELMARLLEIAEYRDLFAEAYPNINEASLGFEHAANAIAAYQIEAFTSLNSPFDVYLSGDNAALSEDQKYGALAFYQSGCGACHSGSLLSDNAFHNIAVPQFGPGKKEGVDYGRFEVTGLEQDKFAFKTPPLRNVLFSAPYMHNGAFKDLNALLGHYEATQGSLNNFDASQLDPSLQATLRNDLNDELMTGLAPDMLELRLEGRFTSLMNFFTSLSDSKLSELSQQIPEQVPSGLAVND